jgi:putative tryptophan/tyrosine transport system substrate-binding protein
VTADTQATVAAKKLTTTTPIVLTQSSDPVQAGLIASFARPGGNVTGVANLGRELAEKRLALLKEAAPRASRVAVLWNVTDEIHRLMWKSEFEGAARHLGVTLVSAGVQSPNEIERAFTTFRERGVEAVLVMPDGLLYTQRAVIVTLTTQHRLPAVHTSRQEAEAGRSWPTERISWRCPGKPRCTWPRS